MALVAFCIGSNENAAANIRLALDELQARFGALCCSNVYRSAALGFDGADFLNLVALTETEEPLTEVVVWLKELERRMGREPDKPRFSSRPVDVDLFVPGAPDGAFGALTLSHQDVMESAFVLRPLAELLPARGLGPGGVSFGDLWKGYDQSRHPLTNVGAI